MSRRSEEQDQARSRGRPKAQPKRWSAQRKAEVVLRLPRGEDIGEVSREVRVAPPELERWRRVFLDGGQQGLKGKNRTGGELMRTRAKLGEMTDRRQPGKRGPKTALRDDELLQEIRTVLKASPFLGEGHRKVKARLAAKGIRVGKNRVLRLMRAHGLLAPVRQGHPRGDRSHSGRIRTERPDELWGTDASRFWTKAEGWCWFFAAVDHCASDVVGWHVAKKSDRWAALEPVRQGVRAHMGGFGKAIALGLGLRHDWGSQFWARQFQAEIKWLGIRSTPAYVGEPECNGVAERFIRTLKEECIYLHDFETLEEAREVIGAFI